MKEEWRKGRVSWDECLMQMAWLISQRSPDPSTQAGACIVTDNNVIVGLGYNGWARGIENDNLPWERDGDFLDTKYPYVVHAEVNAIYNANTSTEGCKLYCTLFPCNECAKTIIQSGIKEIVYLSDKYHDQKEWVASRRMLNLAGIKCRQYTPKFKMEMIENNQLEENTNSKLNLE